MVDARFNRREAIRLGALPLAGCLVPVTRAVDMTGCTAAIAAAQRYRDAEARCPALAYGLDKRGGKCRRIGGKRICGDCVHEVKAEDMPANCLGAPPDAI